MNLTFWKFHWHQGMINVKKNIFPIIALSVAFSMVAGLGYFADSTISSEFNRSYQQGFELVLQDNLYSYGTGFSDGNSYYMDGSNYDNLFDCNISEKIDLIEINIQQNTKLAESTKLSPYTIFSPQESDYITTKNPISEKWNNVNLNSIFIFDENYYKSKEFAYFYPLLIGRHPTNENEILISQNFASSFHLSLNDEFYFATFSTGITQEGFLNSTIVENIDDIPYLKIVGIFQDSKTMVSILDRKTIYNPDTIPFWFGFHNYSLSDEDNPIFNHIAEIDAVNKQKEIIGPVSIRYGINFDFDYDIQPTEIGSAIDWYKAKMVEIEDILDALPDYNNELNLNNYIGLNLQSIDEDMFYTRYLLMIISIPVLGFSILIGSLVIKTNYNNQQEELLLFLSKGTEYKTLRAQLLTDGLLIGIIAGAIGSLFGLITQQLYKITLLGFLGLTNADLVPYYSVKSILTTLIIAVIITLLSMITSMRFIKKLRTDHIIHNMGEEHTPAGFDEIHLFGLSEYDERIRKTNPQEKKLYDDVIALVEKTSSSKTKLLFIFALLPIIFGILIKISQLPSISDNLRYLLEEIRLEDLLKFFAFISPVLLVLGIMRLIYDDKPSIFARLTRTLAKPFVKLNSHLVGIEFIKRKQFKYLIILLAILTSYTSFLNFSIQHNYLAYASRENYTIGSDLRTTYFQSNLANFSIEQVNLIENEFENLKIPESEEYLIETAVAVLMFDYNDQNNGMLKYSESSVYHSGSKSEDVSQIATFNWTKYFATLSHMDNIDYYEDSIDNLISRFSSQPQNISAYYYFSSWGSDTSIGYPGSTSFTLLNTTSTSEISNFTIPATKIHGQVPGLSERYSFEESWIWDYNLIEFLNLSLNNIQIRFLFKISDNAWNYLEALENELITKINQYSQFNQTDNSIFETFYPDESISMFDLYKYGSDFYGVFYVMIFNIGLILAFALGIFIVNFQQENAQINGLLLARGFGKDGVFKFSLAILLISLLLGISIGILAGSLYSILYGEFSGTAMWGNTGFSFNESLPIRANFAELFGYLGIIAAVSLVFYIFSFFIQNRKTIQEFFRRF